MGGTQQNPQNNVYQGWIQINLRTSIWSDYSLSAQRNFGHMITHRTYIEDFDQTVQMCRLTEFSYMYFLGVAVPWLIILLVLSCTGSE